MGHILRCGGPGLVSKSTFDPRLDNTFQLKRDACLCNLSCFGIYNIHMEIVRTKRSGVTSFKGFASIVFSNESCSLSAINRRTHSTGIVSSVDHVFDIDFTRFVCNKLTRFPRPVRVVNRNNRLIRRYRIGDLGGVCPLELFRFIHLNLRTYHTYRVIVHSCYGRSSQ